MNIFMSDTHLPCLQNNYSKKSWKNSDGKETLTCVAKWIKLKVAEIYEF